jgi:uncharacterized protein (TIGR04255 family)
MEKLPIKLELDPIVEAVFELRFISHYPSEAIFGIIYQIIQKEYPNMKSIPLPITQIPEAVRNFDPNLKYQPHNRLQSDLWGINVGPNVISFSAQNPYMGWFKWKEIITKILQKIIELKIFNAIERSGLRYINFIERNVLQVTHIDVKIVGKKLDEQQTSLRTEFREDNYIETIQILNNASMVINNNQQFGSLIDIDIAKDFTNGNANFLYEEIENILEESHLKVKSLFYKFLKDDYLNSLKPIYGEENK